MNWPHRLKLARTYMLCVPSDLDLTSMSPAPRLAYMATSASVHGALERVSWERARAEYLLDASAVLHPVVGVSEEVKAQYSARAAQAAINRTRGRWPWTTPPTDLQPIAHRADAPMKVSSLRASRTLGYADGSRDGRLTCYLWHVISPTLFAREPLSRSGVTCAALRRRASVSRILLVVLDKAGGWKYTARNVCERTGVRITSVRVQESVGVVRGPARTSIGNTAVREQAVRLGRADSIDSESSASMFGRLSLAEIVWSSSWLHALWTCRTTLLSPSAHYVSPASLHCYLVRRLLHIMSPRQPPHASSSKETLDSQFSRGADAGQEESVLDIWSTTYGETAEGQEEVPWHSALTDMDSIGLTPEEGGLEGAGPFDEATQRFFGMGLRGFATPMGESSTMVGAGELWGECPEPFGPDQSPPIPQFVNPRALHDDPSLFPSTPSTSAEPSSRPSSPTPQPDAPTPSLTHPSPAAAVPTPSSVHAPSRRVLRDVDRVNQPVAGPSHEITSQRPRPPVQPKLAAKRSRREFENRPASIPADGITKRLRTKGSAAESSKASSSKAMTSQPPRKRRKQAELEALEVVPKTRCGLDGCDERLPVDLAAARRHMWTHYEAPRQDDDSAAGTKPGRSNKGKQVMRSTDPKAKYVCKYRSAKGQCCTDDGGKPKTLSGGQALERHVQGKHYEWKYACKECDHKFPRRDALKRHEKTKHREPARENGEPPSGDPDSDAESEPEAESDPE